MLKHAKGNLLDMAENGDFDIIVQGCNCHNTMGSGIAREIRERYPQAYEADCETVAGDKTKLGTFTHSHATSSAPIKKDEHDRPILLAHNVEATTHSFYIVNAYTQYNFMPRDVDHFEYEAFQNILNKLYDDSVENFPPNITVNFGFPYIGMGLAGGDKTRIIPMIEGFADKMTALGHTVTLVEFG